MSDRRVPMAFVNGANLRCALCGAFMRRPQADEQRVICGRCKAEWE